jgi:hypothetical protein
MFRYYISFSFAATNGALAIASADYTLTNRIAGVDDLNPVTADLTGKGYTNVHVLAFSLYANPTPAPTPPASHTTNPGTAHPRPRPPRRPGRSA